MLTEDIVWVVPGRNAIAGEYRGLDAVLDYFTRRRELADRSFRMHPGDLLVGEGDHVAVLTDGTATIDGVERRWSTVGLYGCAGSGSRRAGCCRSTRRRSTRSGRRGGERGRDASREACRRAAYLPLSRGRNSPNGGAHLT